MTYTVYWITSDIALDPFVSGYIGITKDFKERMRSHKKNKAKTILTSAIQKHGWTNLSKVVLHEGVSQETALEIERQYRPTQNIGWNLQRGGELGVEPEWYDIEENRASHSLKTSEATKLGIAQKDTREARSERARLCSLNPDTKAKRSAANRGEGNGKALLTEDNVREIKHVLFAQGLPNVEIGERFGVKPYVISFIRTGKNWKHV